jgi:hypothetical protein
MRFTVTDDTRQRYEAFLSDLTRILDDCLAFLNEGAQAVAKSYKAVCPADLALLLLVRHLMESIDGVSILVSRGSVQPCEPLLRSGLEALLGATYILADDSERRGLAFLVADVYGQIKFCRLCDPDDEVGKQIRSRVSADAISGILGQVPVKLARKKLAALQADLDQPQLKPINQEWQRMKAAGKSSKKSATPCPTCGRTDPPAKKGDPDWYSLFGGPRNVQQLAERVKRTDLYELMYRHWSGYTHAANTMRNLHEGADTVLLRPIRHPDGLIVMLRFAALLTLPLALQLIGRYAPESKDAANKRHEEICKAIRMAEKTKNVSWKA